MPASSLSPSLSEWLSSAPHTFIQRLVPWDHSRQRSLFPYALTQTPQFIPIHSDTANPRASVTYTRMNGALHLEEDSVWLMQ